MNSAGHVRHERRKTDPGSLTAVLKALAVAHEHGYPRLVRERLVRRSKLPDYVVDAALAELSAAGMIEDAAWLYIHASSQNPTAEFRLTDAGWREVGGKPIWMEAPA